MAIPTLRHKIILALNKAVDALVQEGYLQGELPKALLQPTKQASHGDYATPIALSLAKSQKKNPREIAARLQESLGDADGLIHKSEIAGPGFLNLFVSSSAWHDHLAFMIKEGKDYLKSDHGKDEKILLEYVSANPTGPLHIAHGRGAVTGDVLARLMNLAGYQASREYYVNDLGNQADIMANSVWLRYGELFGKAFEKPEDFYPGEYITDIAQAIKTNEGDRYLDSPKEEWLPHFRSIAIAEMLKRIKEDLSSFGIDFDRFVSEKELIAEVGLDDMMGRLEESNHIYTEEGKKWFRSTDFGDDKDRVVVRDDGRTTYFASDIAYHDDKLKRGFKKVINIWGADHGGYIARVRAGIEALGHDPKALEVILIQMVRLSRGGETVRMGKRLGTAVWLKDVVEEAGRDATRYFFVMRRSDSQLDFDIELATKKTLDNPVYYAQMGHARLCAIARKAEEKGVEMPVFSDGSLAALTLPEELDLIKSMSEAPQVIADAADAREPHQVLHYVQDLISQFHSYYSKYKGKEMVISDDAEKTRARLLLTMALRTILASLLGDALGVGTPERMVFEDFEETR